MKKIAIMIVVVALAGFNTIVHIVQAAPRDNTWYVGSKLGWSQFHDTGWYNDILNSDSLNHEDQLGVSMFGGYEVNPYVSFEIGYDWLGRMPYKKGNIIKGSFKAQGAQLTTKLGYAVTKNLDIYTRLGGMVWRVDSSNNIAGRNQEIGISPLFAGGLEWSITPDVTTRLEYQWINNMGDGNVVGVRPDSGMLSIGFSHRFDQYKATSAPVVVPIKEAQDKHFALKSDVLFNFNKSTLKPEGQQILNQIYNQISNLDLKDGSVVIVGFTDRIGSDVYNQVLSEKRAQTVVDYLFSKGIPSIKISMHGMGKFNPVTGNTCDNVKARAELIDCLAPDRRVEIEIKNTRDIVT